MTAYAIGLARFLLVAKWAASSVCRMDRTSARPSRVVPLILNGSPFDVVDLPARAIGSRRTGQRYWHVPRSRCSATRLNYRLQFAGHTQ